LEKRFPYLVVDARYEYIRETCTKCSECDGRVESLGVLTVKGINQDGYREILGVAVALGKDEYSWSEVFADLLGRGLDPKAVQYVVSDEYLGQKAAIRRTHRARIGNDAKFITSIMLENKCLVGFRPHCWRRAWV
jgi:transposase-like protein